MPGSEFSCWDGKEGVYFGDITEGKREDWMKAWERKRRKEPNMSPQLCAKVTGMMVVLLFLLLVHYQVGVPVMDQSHIVLGAVQTCTKKMVPALKSLKSNKTRQTQAGEGSNTQAE